MVKLYLYRHEFNKTYIDKFEAVDFDDFIIATGNFRDMSEEEVEEIHKQLEATSNKTVLLIDDGVDIHFYGVKTDES